MEVREDGVDAEGVDDQHPFPTPYPKHPFHLVVPEFILV